MLFWIFVVYCVLCYVIQLLGFLSCYLGIIEYKKATSKLQVAFNVLALIAAPIVLPLLLIWLLIENRK